MKKFFIRILQGVFITLYRVLGASVRVIDDPMDQLLEHHRNGRNFIIAIWHEFSVIGIYWYRHRRGGALVDNSWKGDVLAGILNHFGFRDFRIGPGRGYIEFIRYLRAGHDGTIALDGPAGPARKAKPGVLHAAAKSGALIIPGAAYFSHSIKLSRRWDTYQIPLPFSRLHMVFGEPFEIPEDFRSRQEEILARLNRITDELTAEAARRGRAYRKAVRVHQAAGGLHSTAAGASRAPSRRSNSSTTPDTTPTAKRQGAPV